MPESAIGPVIGAFKITGEAVDFGNPSSNKESKHITYENHLAHSVDSFLDLALALVSLTFISLALWTILSL